MPPEKNGGCERRDWEFQTRITSVSTTETWRILHQRARGTRNGTEIYDASRLRKPFGHLRKKQG